MQIIKSGKVFSCNLTIIRETLNRVWIDGSETLHLQGVGILEETRVLIHKVIKTRCYPLGVFRGAGDRGPTALSAACQKAWEVALEEALEKGAITEEEAKEATNSLCEKISNLNVKN